MLNLKTIVFGALFAALSVSSMAMSGGDHRAERTPGIDARQAEQAARIDAALHEGRLSRKEFRSLQREQTAIRRFEAQAKSDGIVTRSERRELQQMLDRASRHIRRS